ncbi:hypothetical protein ACFL2G_00190 [Candidatus Omnitrophota bacterium]
MKRFRKVLFKIIAICVSVCIFFHAIAYAASNLRNNLMLDEISNEDNQRIVNAEKRIAMENEAEKKIKVVIEYLRPSFEGKDELSGLEFEKHIKKIAKELNTDYLRVRENAINFLPNNFGYGLRGIFSSISSPIFTSLFNRIIVAVLLIIIGIPLFFIFEHLALMGYSNSKTSHDFSGEKHKYKVIIASPWSAIVPLTVFVLTLPSLQDAISLCMHSANYFSVLPVILPSIIVASVYLTTTFLNLGYAMPATADEHLRHELKHVYIFLFLEKLVKMGMVDLSVEKTNKLLGYHQGLPIDSKDKITIYELEKIENMIVNALQGHLNIQSASTMFENKNIVSQEEGKKLSSDIGFKGRFLFFLEKLSSNI